VKHKNDGTNKNEITSPIRSNQGRRTHTILAGLHCREHKSNSIPSPIPILGRSTKTGFKNPIHIKTRYSDLAIFKFNHPLSVDAINQGISPFTLEKLTAKEEYKMNNQEESMEQAMHIAVNDVTKKWKKGTRQPILDPSYFLEIMATFRALILILFGTMSLLFMDIDELYNICLEGH